MPNPESPRKLKVVLDTAILVSAFLKSGGLSSEILRFATLGSFEFISSDDKILACAIASEADYIITRDSHLLDLKGYQGIKILKPEDFIRILRKQP